VACDENEISGTTDVANHPEFAARRTTKMIDEQGGYTPTPVISHAILRHNRERRSGLADGIVISPSHNLPEDGDSSITRPTAARPIRT
jgi:hypothetical protein